MSKLNDAINASLSTLVDAPKGSSVEITVGSDDMVSALLAINAAATFAHSVVATADGITVTKTGGRASAGTGLSAREKSARWLELFTREFDRIRGLTFPMSLDAFLNALSDDVREAFRLNTDWVADLREAVTAGLVTLPKGESLPDALPTKPKPSKADVSAWRDAHEPYHALVTRDVKRALAVVRADGGAEVTATTAVYNLRAVVGSMVSNGATADATPATADATPAKSKVKSKK